MNSGGCFLLRAEAVLADGLDEGAAPDPRAGGRVRVKIVDGSAAGIGPVERILGRPVGRVGHRLVKLPVHHAGKGPRLVHHPCNGVGEGGVLYPVEDHRPHRHLAAVGLAPGLGRDHPGQQRRAVLLAAAPPAAGGHAKRLEGGRPGDAIGGQAVLPLKVFDRLGRLTAVDAIHRAVIVAPIFQLGLDGPQDNSTLSERFPCL